MAMSAESAAIEEAAFYEVKVFAISTLKFAKTRSEGSRFQNSPKTDSEMLQHLNPDFRHSDLRLKEDFSRNRVRSSVINVIEVISQVARKIFIVTKSHRRKDVYPSTGWPVSERVSDWASCLFRILLKNQLKVSTNRVLSTTRSWR